MPSLIVQLDRSRGHGISFTRSRPASAWTRPQTTTTPPGTTPPGTTLPHGPATRPQPAAEQAQSRRRCRRSGQQTRSDAQRAGRSHRTPDSNSAEGGFPWAAAVRLRAAGTTTGRARRAGDRDARARVHRQLRQLADFFHDVKRFVDVANTATSWSAAGYSPSRASRTSGPGDLPQSRAEMKATIYLSPKAQGANRGSDSAGPSTTTPATTTRLEATPSPPLPRRRGHP